MVVGLVAIPLGTLVSSKDQSDSECGAAGSYVTHETKHFIYFYLGKTSSLAVVASWTRESVAHPVLVNQGRNSLSNQNTHAGRVGIAFPPST
jgi:hypothetical protein